MCVLGGEGGGGREWGQGAAAHEERRDSRGAHGHAYERPPLTHSPGMDASVVTTPFRQPSTRRRRVMARVSTPAMPSTCGRGVRVNGGWGSSPVRAAR